MSRCTALGPDTTIVGLAVLVTGGRAFGPCERVFVVLDRVQELYGPIGCIIQGECEGGADRWARQWAFERKVPCPHNFTADWDAAERLFGNRHAAGPIRNKTMVDTRPDLCARFAGGTGTASCVRLARRAGIPILTEEMLAQ